MEHTDVPAFRNCAQCSCGWFAYGTDKEPALFSDHLMSISQLPFVLIERD